MKLNKLAIIILASCTFTTHAKVCMKNPGVIICGKGSVPELSANGAASVQGTIIEGHSLVNGSLTAEHALFTTLLVNGAANLTHCTVNQDAEINGTLQSSFSKFERSLSVATSSLRLTGSTVKAGIKIRHDSDSKQEIFLDDHTLVKGDVFFEDGHGKVFLRDGSRIEGKVIGGELIEE